jgi:hypothetical protein
MDGRVNVADVDRSVMTVENLPNFFGGSSTPMELIRRIAVTDAAVGLSPGEDAQMTVARATERNAASVDYRRPPRRNRPTFCGGRSHAKFAVSRVRPHNRPVAERELIGVR